MELLAKYEIVLNLAESRYFIPSLLPSDLQHSPVIIDAPTNVPTISTVEPSLVQNVEYEEEDDDSSDDDDSREYVNIMVVRAKLLLDNDHCLPPKAADREKSPVDIVHRTKAKTVDCAKVMGDDDHHLLPKSYRSKSFSSSNTYIDRRKSTWPDFFNFNLLPSHSFENATDLFCTYNYREEFSSTRPVDDDMDLTSCPPLCRIWLSPFIPENFWYRLASRIVSATEITNVLLKLLPIAVDSNSLKNTGNSLWSLWKYGIVVMREDITFLELKYEDNIKRNGGLADYPEKHKIYLSISIPEFFSYHKKLNIIDSNVSLSCENILSQATKLLVLIEQLIIEIGEWFPGTLMEDMAGGVISYAPCCFCLQSKSFLKHFSTSDADRYITVFYDGQRLCCFSFTELLSSYSDNQAIVCPHHNKVPVQLCAPDIVSYVSFDSITDCLCFYVGIQRFTRGCLWS